MFMMHGTEHELLHNAENQIATQYPSALMQRAAWENKYITSAGALTASTVIRVEYGSICVGTDQQ
jgi:hypothetical protein